MRAVDTSGAVTRSVAHWRLHSRKVIRCWTQRAVPTGSRHAVSRGRAPRRHIRAAKNLRTGKNRRLEKVNVSNDADRDCHAARTCMRRRSAVRRQAVHRRESFTKGIEGPACDAKGNVYVVNFAEQQTIGKVTPDGKAAVWVKLPGKSTGNGIVFDRKGMMYVADYVGHNVLLIDPATKKISVFAHEAAMNQPNDLAIAPDDVMYASDPNWGKGTGQVWRIDRDGKIVRVAAGHGNHERDRRQPGRQDAVRQ